jgi:hypothetical protein
LGLSRGDLVKTTYNFHYITQMGVQQKRLKPPYLLEPVKGLEPPT